MSPFFVVKGKNVAVARSILAYLTVVLWNNVNNAGFFEAKC
jgi:hypothetical protein